jgi:hypothetical protein
LPRNNPAINSLGFAPGQLKKALLGSWLIISMVGLFCVLFSLLAPEDVVLAASPDCVSMSLYGQPCPACGLTRGFTALSKTDWQGSVQANPAAPYVYLAFLINGIIAASIMARLALRFSRRSNGRGQMEMERICKSCP